MTRFTRIGNNTDLTIRGLNSEQLIDLLQNDFNGLTISTMWNDETCEFEITFNDKYRKSFERWLDVNFEEWNTTVNGYEAMEY